MRLTTLSNYHLIGWLMVQCVFDELILDFCYSDLTWETGGFELASTIILALRVNRLTKCATLILQRKFLFFFRKDWRKMAVQSKYVSYVVYVKTHCLYLCIVSFRCISRCVNVMNLMIRRTRWLIVLTTIITEDK